MDPSQIPTPPESSSSIWYVVGTSAAALLAALTGSGATAKRLKSRYRTVRENMGEDGDLGSSGINRAVTEVRLKAIEEEVKQLRQKWHDSNNILNRISLQIDFLVKEFDEWKDERLRMWERIEKDGASIEVLKSQHAARDGR